MHPAARFVKRQVLLLHLCASSFTKHPCEYIYGVAVVYKAWVFCYCSYTCEQYLLFRYSTEKKALQNNLQLPSSSFVSLNPMDSIYLFKTSISITWFSFCCQPPYSFISFFVHILQFFHQKTFELVIFSIAYNSHFQL